MISRISEIRGVNDQETLLAMEHQFNNDLHEHLKPLIHMLDSNVMPLDQVSLQQHMTAVECWRARIVRLLSLSTSFVQHAESESFRLKKEKGTTGDDQEAHKKHLCAGFKGMSVLLEGLVDCIDSRVNLCKKLAQVDSQGANGGFVRNPAA